MPEDTILPLDQPERARWGIGLLLGIGVLVNYFDRVNLSVSHAALVQDFGISAATFGQLSAAYSWTYALCQLPTGMLLDRFGVRRITLASIGIWIAASLAAAVAPGVLLFFAARLLLGIGEAPTFPANAKAVGAWFPLQERSLATAIFDSAAKLANAIGVPLLGLLLLRVGWRMAFGFTAALSFAYLVAFAIVYREPLRRFHRSSPYVPGPSPTLPAPSFTTLVRHRKIIGLAIGFGSYNYVFYLLLTWLPTYLQEALHLTPKQSFLYTGVPWLVATIADLLIGGVFVDALVRRGHDSSSIRRTVLLAGMLCGLGILGGAFAHTTFAALAFISLAIGGLAVTAPIAWSIPGLLVSNASIGKVGGIINFASQLSAIAAPIVTGITVSATGQFHLAFGIAATYLAIGIAAYALLLGRIEPIVQTES